LSLDSYEHHPVEFRQFHHRLQMSQLTYRCITQAAVKSWPFCFLSLQCTYLHCKFFRLTKICINFHSNYFWRLKIRMQTDSVEYTDSSASSWAEQHQQFRGHPIDQLANLCTPCTDG